MCRPRPANAPRGVESHDLVAPNPFVCSDCGRTDLPEAGGWDPPICLECDAAINEDAIRESMDDEGWLNER